jgi:large subunit GTPase 1
VTRVPQNADTYIPIRQLGAEDGVGGSSATVETVDEHFFRPEAALGSRPFIQGSKLHGQPYTRSQVFPHQTISGEDGTPLGWQGIHTARENPQVSGKKHHKGMKRAKQRSGKGYE